MKSIAWYKKAKDQGSATLEILDDGQVKVSYARFDEYTGSPTSYDDVFQANQVDRNLNAIYNAQLELKQQWDALAERLENLVVLQGDIVAATKSKIPTSL